MQTTDKHFVAGRILSSLNCPVRADDADDDALAQQDDWKQRAIDVALALSLDGHFEWEDFRQALLQQQGTSHPSEASWEFCQRWVHALESVAGQAGLVDAGSLGQLRLLADRAALGRVAHFAGTSRSASLQLL